MDVSNSKENVIEWQTGQKTISVSLTQQKYINKVKALKSKHPDLVKIHTNSDGSIFAKLPLNALKLNIIVKEGREMSDEEKEQFVKRTKAGKKAKQAGK